MTAVVFTLPFVRGEGIGLAIFIVLVVTQRSAPTHVIPAKAGIHRPQADWTYRLESLSPSRHADKSNGTVLSIAGAAPALTRFIRSSLCRMSLARCVHCYRTARLRFWRFRILEGGERRSNPHHSAIQSS